MIAYSRAYFNRYFVNNSFCDKKKSRSSPRLTNIDKYAIIVSRRTAKTVGGSNLPPEMEVSKYERF